VTAVSAHPAREVQLGHPVRSFVGVLLVAALGLVALQLSGVIEPRVTSFDGQGGGTAVNGAAQWTSVVIRNDAPIPVEVTGLRWPTKYATEVRISVQPQGVEVPGGMPPPAGTPTTPFTLQGGERRVITLSGTTSCLGFVTDPLELDVRTVLGIERTVAIEGSEAVDDGPCP
jgi:hypothetical protein